jgi:hypothetical protein
MKTSVPMRGIRPGTLPRPGDFVYLPGSHRVGIVVASERFAGSSAVIAKGLELRLLVDYSMMLPLERDAYVVSRDSVMRFVRHFAEAVLLKLPQMAANGRLRAAVVRLLSDPEGIDARGLLEFGDPRDNSDGCYEVIFQQADAWPG